MSDPGQAGGRLRAGERWDAALAAFEAFLDDLEVALAHQDWEAVPTDRTPRVPPGAPSPSQRARSQGLLARAASLEERLRAAMDGVAADLVSLPVKRHAAASYGQLDDPTARPRPDP